MLNFILRQVELKFKTCSASNKLEMSSYCNT